MSWRFLRYGVACAITLMALPLTGCSIEGEGEVTLKLVAADYGVSGVTSSKNYWRELIRRFERENPNIHVDVTVLDWNDVDAYIAELVERGEAPDLAQAGSYSEYASKGLLYPTDEILSIRTEGDFLPELAQQGEYKYEQYGMPFTSSARVLFYNKALFRQAGIENAPTTWTELKRDAQALKDSGTPVPYGLPLGPQEPQAEAFNWILSGGGSYVTPIGSIKIDSDENIQTFEWLQELVADGLTNANPGQTDRREMFDAFIKGDVGMLNGHPSLLGPAAANGVEIGMATVPGKNGPSKRTAAVADWMMAFKSSGKSEEVGKFLDFVYRTENVIKFAKQYYLLPATISADNEARTDTKDAELFAFLNQMPIPDYYPVAQKNWGRVLKKLRSRIGDSVSKNGDPAAVLQDIQRVAFTRRSES